MSIEDEAADYVDAVLIEYEASGAERGEVQRMRVNAYDAVAAGDRIRASGGNVLEWWLVADVRGLGGKPSGKTVRRRVESTDQAAKDLAHLLRLLGVDSYEDALVVLFELTRAGHLPAMAQDRQG